MNIRRFAGSAQGPEKALRNGKVKKENEDRCLERNLGGGIHLLAVMDGIGSHRFGGAATEWLKTHLAESEFSPVLLTSDGLVSSIRDLQAGYAAEWNHPEWLKSGCALVLAMVDEESGKGLLAWMGDSSAFVVPHNLADATESLTVPHSDPNGALTSCFTSDQGLEIGIREFSLQKGDVLALVTDGVAASRDTDVIDEMCRAQPGEIHLIPAGKLKDDATFAALRIDE